jgi:subtilisin-like proprotein convertase family protein
MTRVLTRRAMAAGLITIAGMAVALIAALPAPAGLGPGDRITFSNSNARVITDEPNGGGVLSKIGIRGSARIRDVDVRIRIAHTADADLNIYLVSPTGRFVELSTDNGGTGDDYGAGSLSCAGLKTTFSDEAPTRIQDGAPPFVGRFRPQTRLSALDGKKIGGTWRLQIFDDDAGDTGILGCWQLRVKLR